MTDTIDLGEFEGRKITKTTIAVRRAGDGLSTALKTEPQLLHQGDTVYVVLECEVGKIGFDPYADGVCARVQDLRAGVAVIIDEDAVKAAVDAQREKNQRARDAANGQSTVLDFMELADDHNAGLHTEPVDGCVQCKIEDAEVVPSELER